MNRRQQRATLIGVGLAVLFAAAALVVTALDDTMTFFYGPSELTDKPISPNQRVRLGGLVVAGSLERDGNTVKFVVTDCCATVPVTYTGVLPDLFREGQGVVAEGHLVSGHIFKADTILAKHDEKYMPREVADMLKKNGEWRAPPPPTATQGPAQ